MKNFVSIVSIVALLVAQSAVLIRLIVLENKLIWLQQAESSIIDNSCWSIVLNFIIVALLIAQSAVLICLVVLEKLK